MKRIINIVILSVSFLLTYAAIQNADIEKGDPFVNLVFNQNGYTKENGRGVVSFNVQSDIARAIDVSFFSFPGEYNDKTFTNITIKVNEIELFQKITFSKLGWQEVMTTNSVISLNKGKNTISFISGREDIPLVKNLKMLNNRIVRAQNIDNLEVYLASKARVALYNFNEPLYRPGASLAQTYNYTFVLPINYNVGDHASFYSPSAYNPDASTVDYNMYLFNENPAVYSKSATSNNRYLYWEDDIKVAGLYYLLLETKDPGVVGGVNIHVNNSTFYRYSFVSNTTLPVSKCNSEISWDYYVSDTSYYNIFTVNGRSCDEYHVADPCLWLKKINSDGTEIIEAYNDNNITTSDFIWGNNARIRTKLSNNISYKISLSSGYPYSYQSDTCDLYHSYWNNAVMGYFYNGRNYNFPNLKEEDAIESGNATGYAPMKQYNCIAWSAGIDSVHIWPNNSVGNRNILWFDSLYNNQAVLIQSGIFTRPNRLTKYTRVGATIENSELDLWGTINVTGDTTFTHASIRNRYDGIPHGYDWESKCGPDPRIFHPRYALSGNDTLPGYGEVVAYYRIADGQPLAALNIEELVASGEIEIENIVLTSTEKEVLQSEIKKISLNKQRKFNELYDRWISYTDTKRYESDVWKYKNSIEYKILRNYMACIENGYILAYDKFVNGDIFAMFLIQDYANTKQGSKAKIEWNSIMNKPLPSNIIRSQKANINLFIKNMLQKSYVKSSQITGAIRSNTDKIRVISDNKKITITVNIEKASRYSIYMINLGNNMKHIFVPEILAQQGEYNHEYNAAPGNYIVVCVINGNINSKKIVVR